MKRIDLALIRRWADAIATTDDRETEPGYLDTVDGECSALDIADHLIAGIQHDEALVAALKAQEDAMGARRARLENRARAKRKVAVELLEALGLPKLERPRATIARIKGRTRTEITDLAAIPSQLCTVKTTTAPDTDAIKRLLEAGEDVPGAQLVRGGDTLTIRSA